MRSKKSKKINGGDIIKNIFGGMGQGAMATFSLINMILLGVITVILILNILNIAPFTTRK